jgi:tetratricopeptide (TPR) repeat protein
MVYFQISPVGFDCGTDKNNCERYPDYCRECVKAQLEKFGLNLNYNLKFAIIDSEEKRVQMFQDLTWQKFLDVLNIKHILLMAKESGLAIVDYPISGAGVNTQLLTGFIQANISFSETSNATNGNSNGSNHQFYEFQYDTFNILLKNGEFIRICLVLDHKSSDSLKSLVTDFLSDYESKYLDKIRDHVQKGKMKFDDTKDFIIDIFNIKLVFPMELTHQLLPDELELIKRNPIQKAIIDLAEILLASKAFFFIINLIDEVHKIVHIDANKILYEVYQLIEKKIIIPTTIETAEDKISNFQESRAVRIANNELISSLITNNDALNELKERAKHMSEEEVKSFINSFIRKAETAEKGFVYKEAQKEYEKALYLASGFDYKDEVGSISFAILELDKKIKELDLEYALKMGEKAEKKKDYIKAINYYQQGLKILDEVQELNGNESRIKKLKKKITNIQKNL